MRVGFFTDTYFPQVSGVATSIRTLKEELERHGHEVYIFTTTDPHATHEESDIIRMPSIPFISFKDRRIVVRGMLDAYLQAKKLNLDIIHTHTEFGTGWLGKFVGKHMNIPVVHTYHTMYEDYLHYIAKGKLIRPTHVKQVSRGFCRRLSGIVCPSRRVVDTLDRYNIFTPKEVIPTGVNLDKFKEKQPENIAKIKEKYNINEDEMVLLSLSRISYEKNIQGIINGLSKIVLKFPNTKLLIVGDGPYKDDLVELVEALELSEHVVFTGEVPNDEVSHFYHCGDYFVSLSSSESQGLTYIEALAAGTRVIAKKNPYLDGILKSPSLGITVEKDKDFSREFIDYVENQPEEDTILREEILYDISSDSFGKKIESFYKKSSYYHQNTWFEAEKSGIKLPIRVKLFKK